MPVMYNGLLKNSGTAFSFPLINFAIIFAINFVIIFASIFDFL